MPIRKSSTAKTDINATVTTSGLGVEGKITVVTINSVTWTALPAAPLTDRNGLGLQNDSAIQIKLNFDSGEPGYIGWTINGNGETFLDIRDTVVVFAKSSSGTPSLNIMEVS